MKIINQLVIGAALMLTVSGSLVNAETILWDFKANGTNPALPAAAIDAGWQRVYHQNFTSADISVVFPTNLVQTIGSLTLTWEGGAGSGVYTNTSLIGGNPITGDGFYVNQTNLTKSFSISGFNEGDQVSVYAITGWGGNDKAGMVTVGGETTQALSVNFTGGIPTIDNFTLINSTPFTVGANGLLTGIFGWNTVGNTEAQIGGMILVVTPIPEPSAWALMLSGAALLAWLRRRR